MLRASGITTVTIDYQIAQIDAMRMKNVRSYFGDVTSPHLLRTAGIEQATALVIAIDDKVSTTQLVSHVKQMYPDIKVITRAFDRSHYYQKAKGADVIVCETFYSALELGSLSLSTLGIKPEAIDALKSAYIDIENDHKDKLYGAWQTASGDKHLSPQYREWLINIEKALTEAATHHRQ
ncbi:TrkA family protein [Marinomonas pollencensis]|uniref:TrkA family protein n=2 Tax=Marinomonas pollencensis TaxID=491954 RepID=A0A3E0DSL5_9GAMM|nr:TrkA family protein [Marinomonas pollencensis]